MSRHPVRTDRHLAAADDLREEFERRKKLGQAPRAGWKDAIRYLERSLQSSRYDEIHPPAEPGDR